MHSSLRFLRRAAFLPLAATAGLALCSLAPLRAADHGDAPGVAGDQAADIADTYLFLDPTDNSHIVMIMTFRGFIVPGEAVNFAVFDPSLKFTFFIENTDDAKPDAEISVRFTPKVDPAQPQIASVTLPDGHTFTAPSTIANQAGTAPNPTVTTDQFSGASFFAGEVDDPFFFDIPAFSRFVASVRAKAPDPTVFQRGRDTFAGYNVLSIALRLPIAMVKGTGKTIALNCTTSRRSLVVNPDKTTRAGQYIQIDREGNPAVNVVLIPFTKKDRYNASTPEDDAAGRFATDIVNTLHVFGTDDAHIGILASVAVAKGDYLRMDPTIQNSGPGGGNNAAAGFPNGRRLGDDIIDTYLTIIANGTTLGDNVNSNDSSFRDTFPFLAAPHQPLPGGIDDGTRN